MQWEERRGKSRGLDREATRATVARQRSGDPAHLPALGMGEVEQCLEVVGAEPVIGEQARLDRSHQRAVCMQQPDEDRLSRNLWGQYLTRQ